jgi:hypothetical protein
VRSHPWLQALKRAFGYRTPRSRKTTRRRARVVPYLECLEGRYAPAGVTFIVNTTNDTHQAAAGTDPHDSDGNISLRSAVEAANHEDTNSAGPVTI